MSEAGKDTTIFKLPSGGQEWAALGLALFAVFALVQFGAPIVRQLDFLDQKIRDFFISGAFVSFPFIHRGASQAVSRFKGETVLRLDLSPWFVSGAFVATLLFGWSQILSFLGALTLGTFVQAVGLPADVTDEQLALAQVTSLTWLMLPLVAMAAFFAGFLAYRNTRSHVALAIVFAVVLFVMFNFLVTSVVAPVVIQTALAAGAEGIAQFLSGVGLVAGILFVCASAGALFAYARSESSLGKVTVAARRLSPADREALAADIVKRLTLTAGGKA